MKLSAILTVALLFLPSSGAAPAANVDPSARKKPASPVPDPAKLYDQSTDIGANHIVHYNTNTVLDASGRPVQPVTHYIELASGLNYQDELGQWQKSQDLIELDGNDAKAARGQTKVHFSANIRTAGGIQQTLSDGTVLKSHMLGIDYFDPTTAKSVLLAQTKDSIGVILPPNQLIYRDAFEGLSGDVRYTYTKSGFEQDVILHTSPPSPEELGLSAQTKLEVITEFLDPPQPIKTSMPIRSTTNATANASADQTNTTDSPFIDERLDFGAVRFVQGRAFDMTAGTNGAVTGALQLAKTNGSVPVAKMWIQLGGRQVLLETLRHDDSASMFQTLPKETAPLTHQSSIGRSLPDRLLAQSSRSGSVEIADVSPPIRGLLIDYTEVDGYFGTVEFMGGQTYFVSSGIVADYIYIDGGSAIKLRPDVSIWAYYHIYQQNAGFPAYFAASTDSTIGTFIESGAVQQYHYWGLVSDDLDDTGISLSNLDIRNAHVAFQYEGYQQGEIAYSYLRHIGTTVLSRNGYETELDSDNNLYCDIMQEFWPSPGISWNNITDCSTPTLNAAADSDNDGLPDWWELKYFGNLTSNGGGDADGDGVGNLHEYLNGTDPTSTVNFATFTPLK